MALTNMNGLPLEAGEIRMRGLLSTNTGVRSIETTNFVTENLNRQMEQSSTVSSCTKNSMVMELKLHLMEMYIVGNSIKIYIMDMDT